MRKASLLLALMTLLGSSGCTANIRLGEDLLDAGEIAEDSGTSVSDARVPPRPETGPQCTSACPVCAEGYHSVPNGTCCGGCVKDGDPSCGDGIVQPREACDDGNTASGDGCNATCTQVEPTYECPRPGQRCTPVECTSVACPVCAPGTTLVQDGSCCGTCQPRATCGNGVVEAGEECDDGANGSSGRCSRDCRLLGAPSCGNGVVESGEECDDGNTLDHDGCSSDCRRSLTCAAVVCEPCPPDTRYVDNGTCCGTCEQVQRWTCGDGLLEGPEACDDGNKSSGDGCSAECVVEEGFHCRTDLTRPPPVTECIRPAGCVPGLSHTCNEDPAMSALLGLCRSDGQCTCLEGAGLVRSTGRCESCATVLCNDGCPVGTAHVNDGSCCGSCLPTP